MKEKIYTIPVNEAFDQDGECPLCTLRKKLESESVDYALGAAMMEPDYRITSNEKGYCNTHFAMMLPKKEKLSLALVLDTHMDMVLAELETMRTSVENTKNEKVGLFRKKADGVSAVIKKVDAISSSCVICEKLNSTMERYVSVLFYLWEKEKDFRAKFSASKGFCLEHFNMLLSSADKYLNFNKKSEFVKLIYTIEMNELKRLKDEVHKFTLKFDYRSRGEKWGTEVDAPERAAEKLSGYMRDE